MIFRYVGYKIILLVEHFEEVKIEMMLGPQTLFSIQTVKNNIDDPFDIFLFILSCLLSYLKGPKIQSRNL